MTARRPAAAFFVEAALLLLLAAGMAAALAGVFARARADSRRAAQLTEAVLLAQNAAEAVSAADSPAALAALLGADAAVTADGVRQRCPDGLILTVRWLPENGGAMLYAEIAVCAEGEDPIYTLRTAAYRGGAGG